MTTAKTEGKVLIGFVTSDKADKTITVSITSSRLHPIYRKQYKSTRRFAAHDEKNEAKVGDRVSIVSVAPISRNKSFMLKEILEKAPIRFEDTVEKDVEEITEKKPAEKKAAAPAKAEDSKESDK